MQKKTERPYHHGDLRRVLIQTAMAALVEDGSWEFTFRELARRAGVSHAAPYKHFADKAELLTELAMIGFDELHAALRDAVVEHLGDFAAELEGMAEAYLHFGLENPALYRLMFGAEVSACKPLHTQQRALAPFELLLDVLNRGQTSGDVSELPVRGLAAACWAELHGLTMLKLDGLLHVEKVGENAINIALETLRAGLRPSKQGRDTPHWREVHHEDR